MQNKMGKMLTNLGLGILEKSREYYYPPSMSRMAAENAELSEAEFAKLIRDIDRFSAQFPLPESKPASHRRAQSVCGKG